MKLKSVQISNVLSFKYFENINEAPIIEFDKTLSILIGENGSGKSTVLEVINFIFKKVFFQSYTTNHGAYQTKATQTEENKRNILRAVHTSDVGAFRLDKNWNSPDKPQFIKVKVILDEVDTNNLKILSKNRNALKLSLREYTTLNDYELAFSTNEITVLIHLDRQPGNAFSVTPSVNDGGYNYLVLYNLYKNLIDIHNRDFPNQLIPALSEPFTLLGGYRNYNAYSTTVSLNGSTAPEQIQGIKSNEYSKSTNTTEQSEPVIFQLVRLRLAEKHYDLFPFKYTNEECIEIANNEPFITAINEKLSMVNLKIEIDLIDRKSWVYSFLFYDTIRNKALTDINSLSAGQKAITHLVFEAYGRGDLKGGVVIIDEPEIHLHYQFQHAYLQIIEKLMREQECQYILVTHSESLINSQTIGSVKRFALDSANYTIFKAPVISAVQKALVKILDNTRSTYALFSKTIVLVEGDSDRYFWTSVLTLLSPQKLSEIAILEINGKGNFSIWKVFFENYGLRVLYIGDFDNVFTLDITGSTLIPPGEEEAIRNDLRQKKLDTLTASKKAGLQQKHDLLISDANFTTAPQRALWVLLLDTFKNLIKVSNKEVSDEARLRHHDIDSQIEDLYKDDLFILKQGSLEAYINTSHGNLDDVIPFCEKNLPSWINGTTLNVLEIKEIASKLVE